MILNHTEAGQGKPIVLLHGMAASRRYWEELMPELSKNHRVIAVDLLGFGLSPKPKNVRYDVETHLKSITQTLDYLGVNSPAVLVGHSMGALLALKLSLAEPKRVKRLVMICAPVYTDPAETKRYITKGKLTLRLAYYSWTSHALCSTWCKGLRPISKHVAKLYLRHQPAPVAEDSVYHSWKAYSESLEHVISNQSVEKDLRKLKLTVDLVYADKDGAPTLDNLNDFKPLPASIKLRIIPGSHNLPLDDPQAVTEIIVG